MNILALTAFADNYIWLLHNGRQALVVDPGLAAPVVQALKALNLELVSILVTHHHGDHVGGVAELVNATGAQVYGPAHENLGVDYLPLAQNSPCTALGLHWQVLDVPGHTAGHIAYFHPDVAGKPVLFCGDTLFSGGCGRLFEGTPAQMLASLDQLAALPADTGVYCAHEYTQANLRFARAVEPGNAELQAYEAHCQALRAAGQATLPSTMALERQINPFLRSREPSVRHAVQTHQATADDDVAVFAALRQWKNEFK